MTCLLNHDEENRSIYGVVLRIAFPLGLMVLVMGAYQARWLFMRRSPNYTLADCRLFIRSRTIIVFLVVSFFAYQSISEDLMGTVSCVELDAKEMSDAERHDVPGSEIDFSRFSIARDRYWTEDTTIKCYSRSHTFLVAFLGVPGIAFFLAGVPLYLLIFLLHKRQRGELMELNVLNTYGFIYQNYEDMFVYWEVCILIRKALISAVVVFAYPLGANLQGIMALGVLIIALAFHLVATPFTYLNLNVLETCSLLVSIFTFYSGIVFNDENTTDGGEVLLSVLLVVVNALLALVFCMTVYVYADRCIAEKLKSLGVNDMPKFLWTKATLLICLLFSAGVRAVNVTLRQSTDNRAQKRAKRQARKTAPSGTPSAPAQTVQPSFDRAPNPQDSVVDVAPDASSNIEHT